MSEYTEPVAVCNESDIQENEMKQLDFNENTKILLVKQNGRLLAVGNKCTHYGAPLQTGTLGKGRVRCPWHGACFNLETGDIEDFPGLDSIPCYKVNVQDDGVVMISAKRKDLDKVKRLKDMVKRDENDARVYVVVGGGPAGGVCVETLRQEGFTGRIVMVCRENMLPYDRVKVSKSMDMTPEKLQFRDSAFYAAHDIEVLMGVSATKLNSKSKTLSCSNGTEIKFDKIFIATGSRAIKPPIPGSDLQNVFTVRDLSDATAIHALLKPELNVVCLGSSFIALESASYLVSKVKSVSLIARGPSLLEESFGPAVGKRVVELFQENNVDVVLNSGIVAITGDKRNFVKEVELKDGTKLPCDLLIMGTGSRSYTDFLKGCGVNLNDNGSIDTDKHLMTNIPDIYVGGDIANAPVLSFNNQRAAIGHYQLAQYHGRIAALNMVGKLTDLHAVPFFFTMIFGKGLRYSGYGKYTSTYIEGDLQNFKFVIYFMDASSLVVAVASCGRDPIVAQFAELQSQGKRLYRIDIENKDDPVEWTKMLKEDGSCSS